MIYICFIYIKHYKLIDYICHRFWHHFVITFQNDDEKRSEKIKNDETMTKR